MFDLVMIFSAGFSIAIAALIVLAVLAAIQLVRRIYKRATEKPEYYYAPISWTGHSYNRDQRRG